MNPFGVSGRILLSILLCVASGQSAEQPKSLDLVYRSLDLKYSALGLKGDAQDDGENERTRGALTCPAVPGADALACVTLEPPWKNNQPKVSCIPVGVYQVVITRSEEHTSEL